MPGRAAPATTATPGYGPRRSGAIERSGALARISIRPYRPDDAGTLFAAACESVATVGLWLPWCHAGYAQSEAEAWAGIQSAAFRDGTEYEFVIESEAGRFLGGCGLNYLDRCNRRANLGYWVRASESGRGVATRAVRLLIDWAARETDLDRLEIVVALENRASLRVVEKAGAIREGVLRHRLWIHGVAHDAAVFSILLRADPLNSFVG